jgi:hypothetical protein
MSVHSKGMLWLRSIDVSHGGRHGRQEENMDEREDDVGGCEPVVDDDSDLLVGTRIAMLMGRGESLISILTDMPDVWMRLQPGLLRTAIIEATYGYLSTVAELYVVLNGGEFGSDTVIDGEPHYGYMKIDHDRYRWYRPTASGDAYEELDRRRIAVLVYSYRNAGKRVVDLDKSTGVGGGN